MDIEFDEIDAVNSVPSGNGKMMFLYQSKEMKNMYERYGNQMILLDATYKTTKYALPLFFVVVQANVNFQVCCVIFLQEESTEMMTKSLKIFREWNPMVSPKYAFVDFGEREITSLEIVFRRVKAFLCDFHREQAWHRWTSKIENGFSLFPIRPKLDYVALLILQRTQIAKLLWKSWCHWSVLVKGN